MILFSTSLAEIMSDSEFNANQQRAFRIPKRSRPENVGYQAHKNRHLVSAKLSDVNWMNLRSFLVQTNRNYNSGLNYLIATHPELQDNA